MKYVEKLEPELWFKDEKYGPSLTSLCQKTGGTYYVLRDEMTNNEYFYEWVVELDTGETISSWDYEHFVYGE